MFKEVFMKKLVLAVVIVLVAASTSVAGTNIVIPPGYTQDQFNKLSAELGLAISYVPLAPAEPLSGGVLPHFDIGVAVTSVDINSSDPFWSDVLADVSSALVLPKLHVQMGLPFVPIDVGLVYAKEADSEIEYIGGEIKWAILKGSTVSPAVAIRGAYTALNGIDDLDLSTTSLDVSISKGFAMLTPYAGIGQVWIDSEPKNTPPPTLEKVSESEFKWFIGAKLSLLPVLNIVGEADFAEVNTYSLRLNLHF